MAAILQNLYGRPLPSNGDLAKLSSHPMFKDLQFALLKDCSRVTVPYSLLDSYVQVDTVCSPVLDPAYVAVQEANLQSEFQHLLPVDNIKVYELQEFYNTQCAEIETSRAEAVSILKGKPMLSVLKYQQEVSKLHLYHDQQRMHLTNRVTSSLQLLKMTLPCVETVQNNNSKTKSRQLNARAVEVMTKWFEANLDRPYPSDEEKGIMAEKGGISLSQVKAWFANKRNRTSNTKPKKQKQQVEKKLLNICYELTGKDSAEQQDCIPKNYEQIIQQLNDIVNNSSVFSSNFSLESELTPNEFNIQ